MKHIAERCLTALFEHSEAWGMVWFGLLFWGSVIFAIIRPTLADANPWVLVCAAYAAGLAIGVVAKARGGWL